MVANSVKYDSQLSNPTSNNKVISEFVFSQVRMYGDISVIDLTCAKHSKKCKGGSRTKIGKSSSSRTVYICSEDLN